MTREQLDAIRARVEAATPGPWHVEGESYDECWDEDCGPVPMPWGLAGPTGKSLWSSGAGEYAHPDMATAEFIASAREDVPALLAEVERLRDALAMAVQVSGTMCEKCGWAMKFPGEPCRCELLAEVERLTAERDEACRSREEARAYRDISAKALQEESERHAITRSRVQATLGVLWERGRIARGMHAATTGTALAETVTEVFDRLDRARGEIERLNADPLPAAAWVREVERAAFQRGVAAMREAAASHFSVVAPYDYIAPRIRALPDPEDKS